MKKMTRTCAASACEFLVLSLCFFLVFPPSLALAADPVPSGATDTTMTSAKNGVPVVNIATPNGSGMSHNKFTSYNVDTHGLVLNNGDMSQAARSSQLGGVVLANPNLAAGNQAGIILNEVTGNGRTALNGFTEVLGGKADVIIANPFGITSSGGGFINTNQASLVTGTPVMNGGNLNGFNVNGGDILITGTGMDASAAQVLNLVSRKIAVQGRVNAQNLNMVAGPNNWNHATGATSAIASDGTPAPTWAIDSSALGGMYAGRINLQATEAGVGVRMKGDAAATASDFVITSSGKIEVGSKISAQQGSVKLTTASGGADAIKATDANITAGRHLSLTANNGGVTLVGGGLKAGEKFLVNTGTLSDTASNTAGIADANLRYGKFMSLTGVGAWGLDGVSYGSEGSMRLNTQSLSVGASSLTTLNSGYGMDITATGGNLAFTNAILKSAGNMDLIANTGSIAFGAGAGQGVQSTGGNINFFADSTLSNAGMMSADAGSIVARVNSSFINSGTMVAHGLFDIKSRTGNSVGAVSNSGKILSGSLELQSQQLAVTGGGTIESAGNMGIAVSNDLVIGGAGDTTSRILVATSGTGSGIITAGRELANYGVLHSGYDLTANGGFLNNMSTGGISALNNLTVRATNGNLWNQGALYAGKNLTASVTGVLLNDATLAAPMGTISSGRDMVLSADTFINSSYIDAGRDLTVSASVFKNEVKGGDTRAWGAVGAWDEKPMPNMSSIYLCGVDTCTDQGMEATAYQYQSYTGGTPQFSPHIYGGGAGTVLITGFNTGENTGSAITGNTVTFIGNPGSTFTNTDISLLYRKYLYQFSYHTVTWAVGTNPNPTTKTNITPTVYSEHLRTVSTSPAVIKANTLNGGGFALINNGSPSGSSPLARSAAKTAFSGMTLTPPSNPNGVFVTSQDPTAKCLVESNPLLTSLDDYLGSEYLMKKYGFKPDSVIKRLGDAGYETHLVGKQLAKKTGNKLLAGYSSEKEQMQGLMDNAASQADELGLTYGQALSETAQSMLKEDMVWMVETEVNGQKVLAPVVYLAADTKQMFASGEGASISAQNVNLDLASVKNTGGTISGAKTLNLKTTGNIENISGTIKGGDVSLTSTEGSIINRTQTTTTGGASFSKTQVGKQAGIVATGDLNMDAGKDIANQGASIAAGGDASLTAGNDVILDTVQNTSTSQTFDGITKTSVNTTKQIGSTLSAGGNLKVKAKNDITVAGSKVSAGGDVDLDAGNDINIIARHDKNHVVTNSEKEGFGVAGGLWGKESKSTDHLKTTAKGSTISSGGNTNLSAEKTVLLEGATLNSGKDINVAGTDVKILEARDTDTLKTHSETTSFLSTSAGEGDSASATSGAGANTATGEKASASASASVSAQASASNDAGGLDFKKTITTVTSDERTTAKGSQLNAGGSINISSKKDTTLRGAEVAAGKDINLSGENVNILAAEDTRVTSSKTTTSKVGLYAKTNNAADASAGAAATANAGKTGAKANAGATADANAVSKTTIDFTRKTETTKDTVDITHKGTSIASGGTLNINAKKDLLVHGSDLSGEQGVNLKAKDMAFVAAEDVHVTSTSTTKSSTGLYVDGDANAKAAGNAAAKAGPKLGVGASAGATGSAIAKASLSIGVQNKNSSTSMTEGTTTARVSSIKSGSGSISRTAENSITDVGTDIEAAGDFSQTAKTFDSRAAKNTSFKSTSDSDSTVKAGVYAKAEAGASANAGAKAEVGRKGPTAEADANANVSANVGAGIKMNYNKDSSDTGFISSQAVVSTIKAGGKIKSVTTGATTMEGTKISGGTGVEIGASSLDYKAAKNTTTSSSSTSNSKVAANVGVTRGTGKGIEAGLSGDTSKTETGASTSTAVVGGIESGDNIKIMIKGDTRLEGTNLKAKGDTAIAAGGNVVFDAARDTKTSSESSKNAGGSLNVGESASGSSSKANIAATASLGASEATSSSSTAKIGSITTGGKLNITSGKSVTLEGTKLKAGGDATVSAKENVNFNAAHSTSESKSIGGELSGGIGKTQSSDSTGSTDAKTVNGAIKADYSRTKESKAEAGSLSSGGNLVINSGENVTLEGTDLAAKNKASINAGGTVQLKKAKSTSESTSVGVSLSGSTSTTRKTPKTGPKQSTTASSQKSAPAVPSPATPETKGKNPGTGGTQGSDGSAKSDKDLADWQKKHGNVMQELKAKQSLKSGNAPVTSGEAVKKTPPPVPTAPKPARKNDAPPTGTPAMNDAAISTETKKTVRGSGKLKYENETTQKDVSISAGRGIEVRAGGGL